ncbi:hypothetical protein [Reyranella sp.]|uniref:hypothetical protein n=1 Tax=Reyranella sp. TaxID=1929291 RepID=UPI003BA85D60
MPNVFSDPAAVAHEFWLNGRDSLVHALDHFSERSRERSDRQHHDKWIAMSVHHAAECIANMRLVTFAPTHPLFKLRRGSVYFPTLKDSLEALKAQGFTPPPSRAELKLFDLLTALVPIRHQFMHRMIPAGWDVSEAAMCMIGLLKYVERLMGQAGSDLVWQSIPVERDVMESVHYMRIEAYCNFAGAFVAEKYPRQRLYHCPNCEVHAVANGVCEACYEDLDSVSCPIWEEPAYYSRMGKYVGHVTHADCPHCESTHPV